MGGIPPASGIPRLPALRVAHGLNDLRRLLSVLHLGNDDAHGAALEHLLDDPSDVLIALGGNANDGRQTLLPTVVLL